jgi:mono/diheme cytochrome c family protein
MKAIAAVVVTLTLTLASVAPVRGAPPTRGELLYDNHCTSCHTSIAHVRGNRRANSEAAVELKLGWTEDEVTDVTQHLVNRYYKFDATPKQ